MKPRLRIAILTRNFDPMGGGAERYAVALAERLAVRHEVHVFAQHIAHQAPGLIYHRLPALRKPRWINQLLFAYLAQRHTRVGFDIIHAHENGWAGDVQTVHVRPMRHNLLGGLRGLRRGLRWLKIATSPRLATYLWLERSRFRPCPGRKVVAVSATLRYEVAMSYPESATCLAVIPPGVSLPDKPPTQAEARRALGLPKGIPLLLFVANDLARKGLDTALQALRDSASVLSRCPQLAVVGGSPEQIHHYRRLATRLGLEGQVHFLGPQRAMSIVYAAADLLIHPTREDTFGMVVLEAMAHGLPVVVSRAPWCGMAADLSEKEAWLMDHPDDASSLAQAIQRLLTDEAQWKQLARTGPLVAARYAWDDIAKRHEALYRELLEARCAS
ncbi:MAG: glycosyltransferase family 4 protein [Gammaproteobacteria bacterium]|nr:glycosyltransferase family 4 protein [Gammaproteobacteria bacterium]